jgi:glutamate--cysteine ligase
MDTFLLFCAAYDSPLFSENGYCNRSSDNFATVVKEGRKPGLQLDRNGSAITLAQWGHELLEQMAPYALLV